MFQSPDTLTIRLALRNLLMHVCVIPPLIRSRLAHQDRYRALCWDQVVWKQGWHPQDHVS